MQEQDKQDGAHPDMQHDCARTSMTSNNARKRRQQSRQFKLVGVWEVGLMLWHDVEPVVAGLVEVYGSAWKCMWIVYCHGTQAVFACLGTVIIGERRRQKVCRRACCS
jgi:hypothetical protein